MEGIKSLVAEINQFSEKKSAADGDESMLGEATNTILELEQLSSLLDIRLVIDVAIGLVAGNQKNRIDRSSVY